MRAAASAAVANSARRAMATASLYPARTAGAHPRIARPVRHPGALPVTGARTHAERAAPHPGRVPPRAAHQHEKKARACAGRAAQRSADGCGPEGTVALSRGRGLACAEGPQTEVRVVLEGVDDRALGLGERSGRGVRAVGE